MEERYSSIYLLHLGCANLMKAINMNIVGEGLQPQIADFPRCLDAVDADIIGSVIDPVPQIRNQCLSLALIQLTVENTVLQWNAPATQTAMHSPEPARVGDVVAHDIVNAPIAAQSGNSSLTRQSSWLETPYSVGGSSSIQDAASRKRMLARYSNANAAKCRCN